ncbi:hypothetical protein FOA52_012909 [Chlamydomonas sp. UWO 241]|nr:hypothetical protein FOA52_012909 [Chlamydomonas sp. UWO 241]
MPGGMLCVLGSIDGLHALQRPWLALSTEGAMELYLRAAIQKLVTIWSTSEPAPLMFSHSASDAHAPAMSLAHALANAAPSERSDASVDGTGRIGTERMDVWSSTPSTPSSSARFMARGGQSFAYRGAGADAVASHPLSSFPSSVYASSEHWGASSANFGAPFTNFGVPSTTNFGAPSSTNAIARSPPSLVAPGSNPRYFPAAAAGKASAALRAGAPLARQATGAFGRQEQQAAGGLSGYGAARGGTALLAPPTLLPGSATGDVDVPALEDALAALIRRHDSLCSISGRPGSVLTRVVLGTRGAAAGVAPDFDARLLVG